MLRIPVVQQRSSDRGRDGDEGQDSNDGASDQPLLPVAASIEPTKEIAPPEYRGNPKARPENRCRIAKSQRFSSRDQRYPGEQHRKPREQQRSRNGHSGFSTGCQADRVCRALLSTGPFRPRSSACQAARIGSSLSLQARYFARYAPAGSPLEDRTSRGDGRSTWSRSGRGTGNCGIAMFSPDFFVVGAPKCGTTSAYSYLASHRAIAMSPKKGPHFWSTDIPSPSAIRDAATYEALWRGSYPGLLRGEASVEYLRSSVAIPRICKVNPQAKFIAMLRNPVDMAVAWHSHLLWIFYEDVDSFERAWRLQPERRTGRGVPRDCIMPEWLDYQKICSIGDQLEHFFQAVPEDLRHVVLFDDLRDDPAAAYRGILRFLGVPDDGRTDFPALNSRRRRRSGKVARLHRRLGAALGPLYHPLRRAASAAGVHPSRVLEKVNLRRGPRQDLSPAFRAELADVFRPQVHRIEQLLHRDLAHWR